MVRAAAMMVVKEGKMSLDGCDQSFRTSDL